MAPLGAAPAVSGAKSPSGANTPAPAATGAAMPAGADTSTPTQHAPTNVDTLVPAHRHSDRRPGGSPVSPGATAPSARLAALQGITDVPSQIQWTAMVRATAPGDTGLPPGPPVTVPVPPEPRVSTLVGACWVGVLVSAPAGIAAL